MMLVRVVFLHLLQDTFKAYTINRTHFLPTVVIETQSLVVFARLLDRAVVYLTAVCRVDLQFFI